MLLLEQKKRSEGRNKERNPNEERKDVQKAILSEEGDSGEGEGNDEEYR